MGWTKLDIGATALVAGGIWVFLTWCIGLAVSCWLTNIQVEERWREQYKEIQNEEDYDVLNEFFRSWQAPPFVEVIATHDDYPYEDNFCPDTHPFELAYDLWPGSYTHCDCLQSPSRRYVAMH